MSTIGRFLWCSIWPVVALLCPGSPIETQSRRPAFEDDGRVRETVALSS